MYKTIFFLQIVFVVFVFCVGGCKGKQNVLLWFLLQQLWDKLKVLNSGARLVLLVCFSWNGTEGDSKASSAAPGPPQPQVSVKWLVRWPASAAQRALLEACCGFPHVEQAWGSDVWKSAGAHGAASLDRHRAWLLSLAVTSGMGARGMDQWRLLGCEPGEETPDLVDGPGSKSSSWTVKKGV